MNWQTWLKGLFSAAIGGVATSTTAALTDPQNLSIMDHPGKVGTIAGVSALVSALMYLKQSPLPGGKQ